jgi:hypothetical protein
MAGVAQNYVISGSKIWHEWNFPMSLFNHNSTKTKEIPSFMSKVPREEVNK